MYLNSQGEVIPPPRTRDSSRKEDSLAGTPVAGTVPIGNKDSNPVSASAQNDSANGSAHRSNARSNESASNGQSPHKRGSQDGTSNGKGSDESWRQRGSGAGDEPPVYTDPLEAVDRDSKLSAELIDRELPPQVCLS